jgi:hypothetical protein
MPTPEHRRLAEITGDVAAWRRWGPYVSDRAWATVREDYSADGTAWEHLPHDLARSKAYRWGEDGLAGWCDRYQILVLAHAFWNTRDPILKERLFGLTPNEANHGEDVKEYYFQLDNTPTHSYLKYLYKYPQGEFPYGWLVWENRRRAGQGFEFELLDTGLFDDDRYFDIFIEYAKAGAEDVLVRIEAINRGQKAAPLHMVPQLWFRNTWAWGPSVLPEPTIRPVSAPSGTVCLVADDSALLLPNHLPADYRLGPRYLYGSPGAELLFTNNDTNAARVFGPDHKSRTPFVKDAFHRWVIDREPCLNGEHFGTKAALHYVFQAVAPGGSAVVWLRLADKPLDAPLADADSILAARRTEANHFYDAVHRPSLSDDERRVQRQALAGLLWNKQIYFFDVDAWQKGDHPDWPPPTARKLNRNQHWTHFHSMRVLSVPDKWEYPYFAAWDLAFHCVTLALIDPSLAKDQLETLLSDQFQHPNGQLPASEWEFSDAHPPVHAWAVWRVYNMERIRHGTADRAFLERCFHKLLLNFTWWTNRVDRQGLNVFEGGFLGLDNLAVVDRTDGLGHGAVLEQADGTGWMGMFCLTMMRIALELAAGNDVYETLAARFFRHYVGVAAALKHMGSRGYQLWDERDGFFYDVLRFPDGRFRKFRVRSVAGLVPLFAVERLEQPGLERFKQFAACVQWFLRHRREITRTVVHTTEQNGKTTHVLTIVNQQQLTRMLERLWDPEEFLAPHGIRSLSRYHEEHPFEFDGTFVRYEPAEAVTKMRGGNANWRGPVWLPICFLVVESLRKLGKAFGPALTVRAASHGGRPLTFPQLARDLVERLVKIFLRDDAGRRPLFGGTRKFQEDPLWRDCLLFFEYFHGDNGAGLGASHLTGWTALVASLLDEWRK